MNENPTWKEWAIVAVITVALFSLPFLLSSRVESSPKDIIPDFILFDVDPKAADHFRAWLADHPNHELTMRVNSYGGHVSSMTKMLFYARGANLHCVVDEMAMSAAAVFLIEGCHQVSTTNFAVIMFHRPRMMDQFGNTISLEEWSDPAIETAIMSFLTPEEQVIYREGKEVYIKGDKFVERWNAKKAKV